MTANVILACVIMAAAIVVRAALAERKRPGSARRQWQFLFNRTAVIGGCAAFAALAAAVVVSGRSMTYLAWAFLSALLTAFIIDQLTSQKH
ncbi:hypothetical protein [Streptomyces sp. NPDC017435]|uniref:hypothetical protein n=1 Tax=Streptomyces sp. NPDC017435 TaxID=3364995 RepID=UPI0037BC655B